MYFELKENRPHGTKEDPFSIYHIKDVGRAFQIPVHWHDELEIIYVKSGSLLVSISGENREICILWVHKQEMWITIRFFSHSDI